MGSPLEIALFMYLTITSRISQKQKKKFWQGFPLEEGFLNHLPQLTCTRICSLLSEIQTTKDTVKSIFHSSSLIITTCFSKTLGGIEPWTLGFPSQGLSELGYPKNGVPPLAPLISEPDRWCLSWLSSRKWCLNQLSFLLCLFYASFLPLLCLFYASFIILI